MARLLSCPHCHADFGFDDWAKATSCPACGRRLSFFEASAQAAPAPTGAPAAPAPSPEQPPLPPGARPSDISAARADATPMNATAADPTATNATAANAASADASHGGGSTRPGAGDQAEAWGGAAMGGAAMGGAAMGGPPPPAVAPAPVAAPPGHVAFRVASRPHVYTIGGKALQWSTGWTVVLVIWTIVAVGLVATRVDMGRLTVMTPAESAAIAAVRQIKLPSGASTEAVLRYSATHKLTLEGHVATIPAGGTQMWYAFDRPWEHRVYVYSELPGGSLVGKNAVLSWSVSSGVAVADADTRTALAKAAQIMAHPPSPNSVPAVPGIIPSIPPDLQ